MTRSSIVSFSLLIVCSFVLLATCVQQPEGNGPQLRERIISWTRTQAKPPPLNDAQQALEAELNRIGESFPGTLGIAVVEVESGAQMAFNGRAPLPQQSVSKLWVALTALDLVDQGAFDLSEPVVIEHDDLTVFHQPLRYIVESHGSYETDYRDLLIRALTESDNTANDRLLRRVGGPTAAEAFLRRKRITGVQFGTDERTKQSAIAGLDWVPAYSIGRNFYDARAKVPERERKQAFEAYLADPMDGASALGIANALAKLASGELLSPVSTRFILDTLSHTKSGPQRLKGGVPAGWTIAHKTGTGQVYNGEQSGYNDVGLLTAPDGKQYAIAAMIGRTRASFPQRFDMMQSVTRAVVRYHQGLNSETP